MPPTHLTIDQAASRLHVTARQIRYAIQTGRLTAIKDGKSWQIPIAALSTWPTTAAPAPPPPTTRPTTTAHERPAPTTAEPEPPATPPTSATQPRPPQPPAPKPEPPAAERARRRLRDRIDDALALPERPTKAWSVRDLQAWKALHPALSTVAAAFGSDHPATQHLTAALHDLTRGCHRFHNQDKAAAYRAARDRVCDTINAVLLTDHPEADAIADGLERDGLPAIAGALRAVEHAQSY
jgi:excisionase family DNA binding protein